MFLPHPFTLHSSTSGSQNPRPPLNHLRKLGLCFSDLRLGWPSKKLKGRNRSDRNHISNHHSGGFFGRIFSQVLSHAFFRGSSNILEVGSSVAPISHVGRPCLEGISPENEGASIQTFHPWLSLPCHNSQYHRNMIPTGGQYSKSTVPSAEECAGALGFAEVPQEENEKGEELRPKL